MPSDTIQSEYLISVADLVNRPGASRRIDLALAVPDQLETPVVGIASPLRLVGMLESVVDGILVRGDVETTLHMACARCLTALSEGVRIDVAELFVDPTRAVGGEDAEAEEGYEIRGAEHIDLDTLLRDALAPNAPYQPRCRDDCEGLCVACGTDLNEAECGCTDDDFDPRWAPLAQLRLPDPDDSALPDAGGSTNSGRDGSA